MQRIPAWACQKRPHSSQSHHQLALHMAVFEELVGGAHGRDGQSTQIADLWRLKLPILKPLRQQRQLLSVYPPALGRAIHDAVRQQQEVEDRRLIEEPILVVLRLAVAGIAWPREDRHDMALNLDHIGAEAGHRTTHEIHSGAKELPLIAA